MRTLLTITVIFLVGCAPLSMSKDERISAIGQKAWENLGGTPDTEIYGLPAIGAGVSGSSKRLVLGVPPFPNAITNFFAYYELSQAHTQLWAGRNLPPVVKEATQIAIMFHLAEPITWFKIVSAILRGAKRYADSKEEGQNVIGFYDTFILHYLS